MGFSKLYNKGVIQSQLDRELYLRAASSCIGSTTLYVITFFALRLYSSHSLIAGFAGALIVLSNLLRLWVSKQYLSQKAPQVKKSKRLYGVGVIGSACGFSALSIWVFYTYSFQDTNSHIMLLILSGV